MPQRITTSAKALVEAAEREVETLSIEDALKLHGRDDAVLIDIRDVRELQRDGKVPGAFHCPRGMLEFWIDPQRVPITSRSSPRTRNTCFSAPRACARRSPRKRRSGWD